MAWTQMLLINQESAMFFVVIDAVSVPATAMAFSAPAILGPPFSSLSFHKKRKTRNERQETKDKKRKTRNERQEKKDKGKKTREKRQEKKDKRKKTREKKPREQK